MYVSLFSRCAGMILMHYSNGRSCCGNELSRHIIVSIHWAQEAVERTERENQRMSKRNLCLEFLWLDHNNKYK